jgi:tetratricopeptide (TPR) repeat protein
MSVLGKMLGFGRNEQYDRAIRLFDQGLYEEALFAFDQSRESGRKDPLTERLALFYTAEAHGNLGHCASKRGAWERAEHHFRKALEVHPHYADLHFSLALALRRRLRYAEALEALENALQINPRFAKAHFHRGLALYASGEREKAMEAIQAAVEIEPGFETEAYRTALKEHESGNHASALHALEMVSATEVDDILFHFRLGEDLYRRGMLNDALDEYGKALDLNPSYADIHAHLGIAQAAAEDRKGALASFEKALAINPAYTEARLHLGITLRDLGREGEAIEAFRKVLDADPENTLARQNLDDLQRAKAA